MKKTPKTMQKNIDYLINQEMRPRISRELAQTTTFFKTEFRQLLSTALIVGFGFVIAMVWRDLFISLVSSQMKSPIFDTYPLLSEFVLTIAVTFLAILGIYIVSRWLNKRLKESAEIAIQGMKPISKR